MKKELFIALKTIVETNGDFKFSYALVPKGNDFDVDKGLSEDMEMDLELWVMEYLAPKSEYHATSYKLTFEGDILHFDCNASWGGWLYEDLHTYNDLLTEEIVSLLLPDINYSDVDIESLHLAFEYTLEENNPTFNWWSEYAYYYGDETEIEIPLKPIKTDLEKVLCTILCDFDACGDIEHDGIYHKTISVEESRPTVVESMNFKLKIDLDEFEFEDD